MKNPPAPLLLRTPFLSPLAPSWLQPHFRVYRAHPTDPSQGPQCPRQGGREGAFAWPPPLCILLPTPPLAAPRPRCTMQTPPPIPTQQLWASWSAQGSAPTAVTFRKMRSPCTDEGSVVAEWLSEGRWHPSLLAEFWDTELVGLLGQLVGALGRVRPHPPERGSSRITHAQLSHKHGLDALRE